MEVVKMYLDLIIKPLENEVKKQRLKVKKTRFSFTNKIEKEYLDKIEKLLNVYYKKFEIILSNECK